MAALELLLRDKVADGSHAKSPAATVHEVARAVLCALPWHPTAAQAVHSGNIITVAVSCDECLLATGSTDRTICIFSVASVSAPAPLQPLAQLKVTDAVCLDISWGR